MLVHIAICYLLDLVQYPDEILLLLIRPLRIEVTILVEDHIGSDFAWGWSAHTSWQLTLGHIGLLVILHLWDPIVVGEDLTMLTLEVVDRSK